MTAATAEQLRDVATLDELYAELGHMDMTAGWIRRAIPILRAEPATPYVAAHWRYHECRAALDAAGRLINTELAERRNLVMRNPAEGNDFGTTNTLVCAYQMILPGEKARTHRHAPHALRVILEAKGSFSTVDGEKTLMESGDIVLTPGWTWHGHGHDGDEPAYWFDGLDVPLTHLLEPMFMEDHPDGFVEVDALTTETPNRFTWDGTQRALETAEADPEGYFGPRIRLDAPTMPTIGLYVHRMESGLRTRRHRAAANTVYCVMQGAGVSVIDGVEIDWRFGDTFAAPCWKWIEHHATADSVVFAMTDEPLMRFANYYRFEGEQ